jgi:membrane protein
MGAALACYAVFSLAPLLLIVVSVSGLVFGEDAARGEIQAQLQNLIGAEARARSRRFWPACANPPKGLAATVVCLVLVFVGAPTVFAEPQDALDRIWRVPGRTRKGGWLTLVRTRLVAFRMILTVEFLLIVSLLTTAILAAAVRYLDPAFGV